MAKRRKAVAAPSADRWPTMLHKDGSTVDYSLKFIPRPLWRAVRVRALDDNVSVRHLLMAALEHYAAGSLTAADLMATTAK